MNPFADWSVLDAWIVVTGALAAGACALPGCLLMLRRQSLMADALSHATLPGIVLAYLFLGWAEDVHWLGRSQADAARPLVMLVGAALSGLVLGGAAEAIRAWGRVDPGAALGVVYTSLFALGLLLIRLTSDSAHLDPSCVLYGNLETSVAGALLRGGMPAAAWVNGSLLVGNALLVTLFFKELQLALFDPDAAAMLGLPVAVIQQGVVAVAAITLVLVFETVGSMLAAAMSIAPAATACLLTTRFGRALGLSVVIAAVTAAAGHLLAILVPPILGRLLDAPDLRDCSTTGMMAVASSGGFLLAWIAAPRNGWLRRLADSVALSIRMIQEDQLGSLYRAAEQNSVDIASSMALRRTVGWRHRLAEQLLRWRGFVVATPGGEGLQLTERGREAGLRVVRSHRLWEAYMARQLGLPDDHLHPTAELVEHFLDPSLRAALAADLDDPSLDPHGQSIPAESNSNGRSPAE